MKSIFIAYTTDVWHTHSSKDIIAVTTTKPNAIKICKQYGRKYGKRINDEQLELLDRLNQTQGYSGDMEFQLEEYDKNKLL